jgi:hypothetical protein
MRDVALHAFQHGTGDHFGLLAGHVEKKIL